VATDLDAEFEKDAKIYSKSELDEEFERELKAQKPEVRDAAPDVPEATYGESASMGAFSGLPIIGGLADEGIAGAQTGWEALKRYLGDKDAANGMALGDYYRDQRDSLRGGAEIARAANPKLSFASEIGGGLVGGYGAAGALSNLGKIKSLATVAPKLTSIQGLPGLGKIAGIGAVEGFNRSDDKSLAGNLEDAAIGGAISGTLGAAAKGVSSLIGKNSGKAHMACLQRK